MSTGKSGESPFFLPPALSVALKRASGLLCAHTFGGGDNTQIIEETYDWAYPLTQRRLTDRIVLHHAAASEATAQQIHFWHQGRGWAGIGYHYYVRKSGEIIRGRPESTVGTHMVDFNYRSVAVCFEGNFQEERMGEAQFNAGRALVAELRGRYPDAIVIGHRDGNATACPGANFPFEEMIEEMTGEEIFQKLAAYLAALPESDWSREEGFWQSAVASGVTDGTAPQGFITREQMTAVLGRLGLIERP